jgi:DNA-binding LacI/PurR family transcriptional regulator
MPVVALQPGISIEDGISSVAIDFDAGVAAVVEHLVGRGARRLVHVPGPQNLSTVQARITAWSRELTRRGLAAVVAQPVPMTGPGGYDAGTRMLEEGVPDAVFAVNDLVALGIIRALTEHGIRVPDDVAVVGVDDWSGASYTSPTLVQPLPARRRTRGGGSLLGRGRYWRDATPYGADRTTPDHP